MIWLRIREYFKHPAEDVRQARPIVPGRLYNNFGYICKAVPLSGKELCYIDDMKDDLSLPVCVVSDGDNRTPDRLRQLHGIMKEREGTPVKCEFCDFWGQGLPCPVYNALKDGSIVCDTNKYVILRKQR